MNLIATALQYIGQKEKPKNSGFVDPALEAKMLAIGWQPGWPYCVLGGKLIYKESDGAKPEILKLFTPNCQDTFENFLKAGVPITMLPTPGSFVCWEAWKDGRLTTMGHWGLVLERIGLSKFRCFEGNTGPDGGRDGDGFYAKMRDIVRTPSSSGLSLVVKGFIHV